MPNEILDKKHKMLLLFHTNDYYHARLLNKKLASLGINIINKEVSYITENDKYTSNNIVILLSSALFDSYHSLTTVYSILNKKQEDLRICTILLDSNSLHQISAIENFKIGNSFGFNSDHRNENIYNSDLHFINEQKKYVSYFTEQYKKHLKSLIDLPENEKNNKTEELELYKEIYNNLSDLKKKLLENPLQNFNFLLFKGFSPIIKFFNF